MLYPKNLQLLGRFLVVFSRDSFMNILDDLKTLGKEFISMFNGLPKPAQDDILKAFPAIGSYATSNICQFFFICRSHVFSLKYNYVGNW